MVSFASIPTLIELIINLSRSVFVLLVFFFVFFGCLCNPIAMVRNADLLSYHRESFFQFLMLQTTPGTSQLVLTFYKTNSSQYRNGSKKPETLKKYFRQCMAVKKLSLLSQNAYFRCGKVH